MIVICVTLYFIDMMNFEDSILYWLVVPVLVIMTVAVRVALPGSSEQVSEHESKLYSKWLVPKFVLVTVIKESS